LSFPTRRSSDLVIYFELNGQSREIFVQERSVESTVDALPNAENGNPKHIGATMPGTVIETLDKAGDKVEKGDYLLITEAMKMETTIHASFTGVIKAVHVIDGTDIGVKDLLVEFE